MGSRVLHYDGSAWTEVPGPAGGVGLVALWGLAPDDLWATSGPKIYRYQGASTGWVELDHGIPNPPDFDAIWVAAPDDFVVGGGEVNEEIVRVKGSTVTRSYTYGKTTGIWGSGDSDIWAVSEMGGFWHFDGSAWQKVEVSTGGDRPTGVWGFSASDVWAVGNEETLQHWDGSAWTPTDSADSLAAVWGAASDDVWAAGDEGAVSHYDGKTWSASDPAGTGVFFTAMSGSGPKSVWAVGYELNTAGNHGVIFRLQ